MSSDATPDQVLAVLRRLADKEDRLLTLSGEGDAVAVEVTHEQLIERWPTLREWLERDREDLRFDRRLTEAAESWAKGEGALWRGIDLARLDRFARRRRPDLTPLQLQFWRRSRRAGQISLGAWVGGALVVMGLTVGFIIQQQGRLSAEAQRVADAEKAQLALKAEVQRADEAAAATSAQRDEALRKESLLLAELSQRETARGNATDGLLIALEGLPSSEAEPSRPYVAATEKAAWDAESALKELQVLRGHEGGVGSAAFDAAGGRIVSAGRDGTVRVWRSFPDLISLIEQACAVLPRDLGTEGRRRYFLSTDGPETDGFLAPGRMPRRCHQLLGR